MGSKKGELRTLSSKKINKLYYQYHQHGVWGFYEEREFIENLFNQRFNYLILMYSLFITASAIVDTKQNLIIVLSLGTLFTFLVSLTIIRAYVKLIILLKILHKLKGHVFQVVQAKVVALKCKGLFGVNHITGIYIPIICIITLILGLILTICGTITVSNC